MADRKSAEIPQTSDKRQYHTSVAPGDVAPYILLCGDPARAYKVAELFDEARKPITHREYVTITGRYKGVDVTVMATGMGPDNTEMAVIEISQIMQSPTFLRIGTCGGLQKHIAAGDLVISKGAVRMEDTSTAYVYEGYPALAHHEVILAMLQAAKDVGAKHHLGVTATASGFYGKQGRSTDIFKARDPELPAKLDQMNVANLEMESSCLFTLSTYANFRAGAVCAVVANRHANTFISDDEMATAVMNCCKTGLRAIEILAKMDSAKKDSACWLPTMGLKE
ncbi:MAG: uridine phosphorylase [Deltaproteobacteria bacterium CG11_big_fil_rev_8_21_14_0_20_47_16]|nr:MAG: uridine phosphorylase [Deltaproteobacteria bacterium CG11_big_fil_rev_8_21_14_0_20_47_16]